MLRYLPVNIAIIAAIFCTACSTTPQAVRTSPADASGEVYDPFEGFNRNIYKFNEAADKYLINPLATVYKFILPKPIRQGINNASRNLGEPIIFVNEVLQLDGTDASESVGRFLVNSTVGLGGFINVTEKDGFSQTREDFGQTLATYNIPSGPYIVLPLLGPSNARDIVGRVGDGVINPLTWADFQGDQSIQIGRRVSNGLDSRVRAEPFLENIRGAADPYVNLRGVYTQNRLSNIHEDADVFDGFADFDEGGDGEAIDDGFADFE